MNAPALDWNSAALAAHEARQDRLDALLDQAAEEVSADPVEYVLAEVEAADDDTRHEWLVDILGARARLVWTTRQMRNGASENLFETLAERATKRRYEDLVREHFG